MATAARRTASTGAPTATAAAVPVYEASSPYAGQAATSVQRTPDGPMMTATGTYTGTTAIPAIAPPGAFGRNDPAIREQLGADGVQAVLDYRSLTGSYPDLSGVFGAGGAQADGAAGPMQAGLFAGGLSGLNLWILLSVTGLALLVIMGGKGKGKR